MFLLPLDRRINDLKPYATLGLAATNTVCFFASLWTSGGLDGLQHLWFRMGFVPASPSLAAAVTHMFIHAGWEHLAGNMVFLVFMGMNCERKLGSALFLVLYFLSGFGAVALFALFNAGSEVPLGGASGAVSGVAGLYFALFARREVDVLWYVLVTAGTFRVPAWTCTLLWAAVETVQAILLNGRQMVAHWAHVGGFVVGVGSIAILFRVFRFRGRAETTAPVTVPLPERSFTELSYIPGPPTDTRTYLLVARRFAQPPTLAGVSGPPACVARGLPFLRAQELQERLETAGYPVMLFSEPHRVNLPPLRFVRSVSFDHGSVQLTDDLENVRQRALSSLYLASAGAVRTPQGVKTYLDLFVTSPWTVFRLSDGDLSGIAREMRTRAPGMRASAPFVALAEQGSPSGEPFADLRAFDAFNDWLLQVCVGGSGESA